MYKLIQEYVLDFSKKEYLGPYPHTKCRFCGESIPKVTFKNKAHVISEFLNNKYFLSNYECDTCNLKFSAFEDQLAKFHQLYRGARSLHTKNGTAKLEKGFITEYDPLSGLFHVHTTEEFSYNQTACIVLNNTFFISYKVKFIPELIYKALLKFALSVLPEPYIQSFEHYISYLENGNCKLNPESYDQYIIVLHEPVVHPRIQIYEKDHHALSLPYILVKIEVFQFIYNIFLFLPNETIKPYTNTKNPTQLYNLLSFSSQKHFSIQHRNLSSSKYTEETHYECISGYIK